MNSSEQAAVALAGSSVATDAAERLLLDAIAKGARTLHLEPHQNGARIRYRIDGSLQELTQFSHHALRSLIAHFKYRANLAPAENRWSQEGRFTVHSRAGTYTIKLTTLPLAHGEKAVLHLFNSRHYTHSLAELGIWGDTRKRLNTALTASQGLIVVSGPQHSGVSTTLRSLLHTLNKPSHSVISLEDPIEYRLPGVHQLNIDRRHGLDLVRGFEIALRGDANTIMVGSLHGQRATDAALEASAKGRLVIAGMHTPSIVQTMHHLSVAASEQYLLAHNLQAVIHQQLVRRLCDNCKVPGRPDAAMLRKITSRTRITVATLQHFMEETAKHQQTNQTLQISMPKGCAECHHTGFKGQIGLFEVLTPTLHMQRRLQAHTDPVAVLHNAVKDGMMPMLVDGFVKALTGLTTIDEVLHSYK